jgi:hypothetical protein
MNTEKINKLIEEKGRLCISIIVPTFSRGTDRMQNKEIIRKSIGKLDDIMNLEKTSSRDATILRPRLDKLIEELDTAHLMGGVGFFVSGELAEKVIFPFSVQEKIKVDDTFEIEELLMLKQYIARYHVLVIGKKIIRLFKSRGTKLEEISDDNFPFRLEEEYEYSPPSLGSSYGHSLKAFEKDKGILTTIHLRSNLKHVDDALSRYVDDEEGKIILAGTKTMTEDFENLTRHGKSIVAKLDGSFRDRNFSELEFAAWSAYVNSVDEENNQLVSRLKERAPNEVAFGVHDVVRAAQESRGLVLFVEKGYKESAYLDGYGNIEAEPGVNLQFVDDVVSHIIELVYRKNGKVVFVDTGKVGHNKKIALLLRY